MDRVRIGIVGVGNIATLNVPGYLAHEQCDVVALCDPRADVLETPAREWGVDRDVHRPRRAARRSRHRRGRDPRPDAAPRRARDRGARAGKHVSVQKPIANTVSDGRAHGAGRDRRGRDLPGHRAGVLLPAAPQGA